MDTGSVDTIKRKGGDGKEKNVPMEISVPSDLDDMERQHFEDIKNRLTKKNWRVSDGEVSKGNENQGDMLLEQQSEIRASTRRPADTAANVPPSLSRFHSEHIRTCNDSSSLSSIPMSKSQSEVGRRGGM